MEPSEAYEVIHYVPAPNLPYSQPGSCYTLVRLPDDDPTAGRNTGTLLGSWNGKKSVWMRCQKKSSWFLDHRQIKWFSSPNVQTLKETCTTSEEITLELKILRASQAALIVKMIRSYETCVKTCPIFLQCLVRLVVLWSTWLETATPTQESLTMTVTTMNMWYVTSAPPQTIKTKRMSLVYFHRCKTIFCFPLLVLPSFLFLVLFLSSRIWRWRLPTTSRRFWSQTLEQHGKKWEMNLRKKRLLPWRLYGL